MSGLIDVTDLLADPDFVSALTIIHRTPTVDTYGQNQLAEVGNPTIGSVQPASSKTIQRLPEAMRVANVMSFWVKGPIVTDGCGQYPDVLVFNGSRFQVQTVMDWTGWGAGWSEGTCVREKPTL